MVHSWWSSPTLAGNARLNSTNARKPAVRTATQPCQLGVAVQEDVQAAHRHARGQAGQRRVGGTQLLDHRKGERGPDVPRAVPPRVAVVVRVPDHVVRANVVEPDQALGLVDIHGLQEQAIHRCEQRRVRSDAERERQEDDERPGLGAEHDADGKARGRERSWVPFGLSDRD